MTGQDDTPVVMDIQRIRELLPHRYPFLFIDRIIEVDEKKMRIVALKNVTANEPHFAGHFPDYPIMPGVLLVEAMAQTAAVFMLSQPGNQGKIPYFASIENARFRRPVVPGDQVRVEVDVIRARSRVGKSQARCLVNGQVVAQAVLTCILGDAAGLPAPEA